MEKRWGSKEQREVKMEGRRDGEVSSRERDEDGREKRWGSMEHGER